MKRYAGCIVQDDMVSSNETLEDCLRNMGKGAAVAEPSLGRGGDRESLLGLLRGRGVSLGSDGLDLRFVPELVRETVKDDTRSGED